jgi:hypothetical protein
MIRHLLGVLDLWTGCPRGRQDGRLDPMAMSELERRVLRDIEVRLAADSPRLERSLRAFARVCRNSPAQPQPLVTRGWFGPVQRRALRVGVAATALLLVIAALLPSNRGPNLRSGAPAHSSAPAGPSDCARSCSAPRRGPVTAGPRLDPAGRLS